MQTDDVRSREKLVDGHHGHGRILHGRAVECNRLKPDALGQARHLAADAAEADQPERLASQLRALHHLPTAVAQDLVHDGDVAGGGEDETHGMLGHCGVAITLDGRDLDAEPVCGGKIDEAAGAGAEEDDMLQASAARERGLAKVARVVDDGVIALKQLGDIALGDRPPVDGDGDIALPEHALPEPVDVGCRVDKKRLRHRLVLARVRPRSALNPSARCPS